MLNFDSFTLIPSYSDIASRNEIDISVNIGGEISKLPIINANMLSICTPEMINILSDKYETFSSYHRFFKNDEIKKITLIDLIKSFDISKYCNILSKFWMSIGTKKEEYSFIDWLYKNGNRKVIIDVNHGHHKAVAETISFIKQTFPGMQIMAGNVSSTDGISFLKNAGADIIKCGNSFGATCSTKNATSFGVHPIHVVKTYREETNDWETVLCPDGGIRSPGDIAKCLIWGNLVMLGSMLGGCNESYGTRITHNGIIYKEVFGNASIKTKQVATEENHVKFIEGITNLIPCTGPLNNLLDGISDGIKSAFSFVGARTFNEYQKAAQKQILYV